MRSAGLAPLLVLLLVAFFPPSLAVQVASSGPVQVTALAVEETRQGLVGTSALVEAQVQEGAGRVYVATKPLAQADMQGSARLAAQVAASTLGADWTRYDWLVTFQSGSTLIGGPSAGADMALAFTVALHNLLDPAAPWSLDPAVAATGTINPDGTIGPVGGIPAKAQGAAEAGIRTFLFPAGLEQAPSQQATPAGTRTVLVDMAQHCSGLGITCRSAATIGEVLEAAARVRLERPAVAVPSTLDYAALLGPGVRSDVEELRSRLEAATQDASQPSAAGLPASARQAIQAELEAAAQSLARAEEDAQAQRYYLAASDAFRGAIAAGRAENLTRHHLGGQDGRVVLEALATCKANVERAKRVLDQPAGDLNALWAVGSAQERHTQALALQREAEQAQQAPRGSGWVASLAASSFCTERAKTALHWAGLAALFPPGPAVSAQAVAQEGLEQATDLVSYAQAVLGSGAGAAQARLEAARSAAAAGHWPEAAVVAAQAQALASLAVQTGGGAAVPGSVLEAARDGAARAIQAARSAGAEPMAAVSLVELAQAQEEPSTALEGLWTARNLALLQAVPPAPGLVRIHLLGDPLLERALGTAILAGLAGLAVAVSLSAWRRAR